MRCPFTNATVEWASPTRIVVTIVEQPACPSLLQGGVIKAHQHTNDGPNLKAMITSRNIVAHNTNGICGEGSPAEIVDLDAARRTRQSRVGRRNAVRAVSKDGFEDVESERISGILAVLRPAVRVCAQSQIEEVGEDEWEDPVCEGPESGWGPPVACEEREEIWDEEILAVCPR